ncbi:MAG: DCC1-like thiol-disulfide oxidoreductase family protein [Candidatus Nanopelagicales bacterium]
MPTALMTGPLLVFDGDCAFCTSSVLWLGRRFPDGFTAVPYQRVDLDRLGLTERECHDRVQWIADAQAPRTSARESGARAVGALLRAGGRARHDLVGTLWAAAGVLPFVPPTSWAAERVYRVVAANRTRLPGGTPACAA